MNILWFLFLALTPLYLLPSGGFQIAHIPLVLIGALCIFRRDRQIFSPIPIKAYLQFTLYACLVNVCFFILSDWREWGFIFSSLILGFNAITLSLAYSVCSSRKGVYYTSVAIILIGIVQCLAYLQLGGNYGGGRYMAFFNDPNQLSSWALFSLTIVALFYIHGFIGQKILLLMVGISSTLLILTASKSGIISLGILLLIVFWKSKFWVKLLCVCGCILGISFLAPAILELEIYNRMSSFSFDSIDQDRHWYYLWEFPVYNILGAGAGSYDRFDPISPLEVHSTLLTVVFCYGIPGTFLFLLFLKKCFYRTPTCHHLFFALPILANFLSLNMIRMTSLYVLLGVSARLLDLEMKQQRHPSTD